MHAHAPREHFAQRFVGGGIGALAVVGDSALVHHHQLVSVLHELNMALHADELVVVADGRIVHHGDCADPATHRAVEQVFGGSPKKRSSP